MLIHKVCHRKKIAHKLNLQCGSIFSWPLFQKIFKEDEWKLLELASLIAHDGYDAVRQFVEGLKYEQNPQKMLSKFVNFLQAEAAAFKKYYKAGQVERKVTTIKQLMQPATHLYVKRYYGDFLSYKHHILLTGAEYYEDDLVSFIKLTFMLLIPKE